MSDQDIWLTPDQAADLSGRSMISIRALVETTYENEGTRHLLQVFKNQANANEVSYLLHRSLVTSGGLKDVQESDIVERLSARIQQLETEAEVLRFRAATVRQDSTATASPPSIQVAQLVVEPPKPILPPDNIQPSKNNTSSGIFWLLLGLFILLTFVIVIFILIKQGFIQLPQK